MFTKLFVCEDFCFFKSVHTFADFQIYVTFRIEKIVSDMILIDDLFFNISTMEAHILIDVNFRIERKVFGISGAIASTAMHI